MNQSQYLHDRNKLDYRFKEAKEIRDALKRPEVSNLANHGYPWIIVSMTIGELRGLLTMDLASNN